MIKGPAYNVIVCIYEISECDNSGQGIIVSIVFIRKKVPGFFTNLYFLGFPGLLRTLNKTI